MKQSIKPIIRSPLNYVGGKARLLPQMLPYFPSSYERLIDVFAGGANVAVNSSAKSIALNDINFYVVEIIEYFYQNSLKHILEGIHGYVDKYKLSKTNRAGFLSLRENYNKTPANRCPIKLYALICHSYNYQFRFNNNHEYNNPFGKNRSHFSARLTERLSSFVAEIKKKEIQFSSKDFVCFLDGIKLKPTDFVYLDPPYLITTASYNDGNRGFKNWTLSQEKKLLDTIDQINAIGVPFALSNVTEHKGEVNSALLKWASKYNVHKLSYSYKNSAYNTRRTESQEVLITNY